MKSKVILKKQDMVFCLVLFLLFITVVTSFVNADLAPVPLGVEGIVYHLDGITQVFEGFNVTVTNLDTSETVVGQTGKGLPGRYSFSLNWSKNDNIRVGASNPYHSNHTDLVLDGVIRDANIYLDMDFQNVAPRITSQPSLDAMEDTLYEYQVTAFDWNEDTLNYSLISNPDNMSINNTSGLISWTPSRSQKGEHTVIINVSDGNLSDLQEFEIEVYVENTAPNIISVPGNNITKGDDYSYELIVSDDDLDYLRYEVYKGAPGMYFVNNTLYYTNSSNDLGTYIVILDVYDRFDIRSRQIFFFTINERTSSGGSAKHSTVTLVEDTDEVKESVTSKRSFNFTTREIPVKEILVEDLSRNIRIDLNLIDNLEQNINLPKTRVYKYFSITPSETIGKNVKIKFLISEDWISSYDLNPEDIVLSKYIGGEWVSLETKMLENIASGDVKEIYYEAQSFGFSLFAVTHKESVNPKSPSVKVNKINSTFSVMGHFSIEGMTYSSISNRNKRFLQNTIIIEVTNERTKDSSVAILEDFEGFLYQTSFVGEKGDEISITAKIVQSLSENRLSDIYSNNDIGSYNDSSVEILYSGSFILENVSNVINIVADQDQISTHLKRNTPKYELIALLAVLLLVLIGLYFFVFKKS